MRFLSFVIWFTFLFFGCGQGENSQKNLRVLSKNKVDETIFDIGDWDGYEDGSEDWVIETQEL